MYYPGLIAVAFGALLQILGGIAEPWRARLTAIGYAALFVLSAYLLNAPLSLPPADAVDSLQLSCLLLAAYVVFFPRLDSTNYATRIFYVAAVGLLLFWYIRREVWQPAQARNVIAFFCLGLGSWSILISGFHKVRQVSMLSLMLMQAAALSYILFLSGGIMLGRMVLVATVFLVAAMPAAFRGKLSSAGMIPFMSVFLAAFAAVAYFYSNINPWRLMAAFIPLLPILLRAWLPLPRQPLREAVTLCLLAGIPLGYFLWRLYTNSGI